jgi:RNA polymerase sigma-70 factor, ECF subfamily
MYLLEKLTPIERGVMILKEAFGIDYLDIATIFDITYENCRQHFSRAKKKLMLEKTKFQVDNHEHEKILREFLAACISNNLDGIYQRL